MRFSFVALLGLSVAGAVQAFSFYPRQNIPTCAVNCLTSAETAATTCGGSTTNLTCLCADPAFISTATSCAVSSCSASDLATTLSLAEEECSAVGVTLNPTSISAMLSATGSSAASMTTASSGSSMSLSPSSMSTMSTSSTASPAATTSSAAFEALRAPTTISGLLALIGLAVVL